MVCPKCGGTEFYTEGHPSSCKGCRKASAQRYAEKGEAIRAAQKAKRAAAAPKRERVRLPEAELRRRQKVRKRRWETANPEKARAAKRREYHRNVTRYRSRTQSEEGRARNRSHQRARRVGRVRLSIEYAEVLVHDPCSYCGAAATGVDHIEALNGGGSNDWSNLTGACQTCNSGKRDRPLLGFLAKR